MRIPGFGIDRRATHRLWFAVATIMAGLVLVSLAMTWSIVRSESERMESGQREVAAQRVITEAVRLWSALQMTESDQRRFLVTGLTDAQGSYEADVQDAAAALDRLERVTADNPTQRGRIEVLRPVIADRLAVLAETAARMRDGDRKGVMDIVGGGRGAALMNEARRLIDAVDGDERTRLAAYRGVADQAANRDRALAYTLMTVGLLTLFGAILATVLAVHAIGRSRMSIVLSASERRLRLFVERAPASIAMFDREMRYLFASDRYVTDYGLTGPGAGNALTGQSHYTVFPDVPQRWRAIHRRVLAGETISADEDRFPRADGSIEWVRWEMTPWLQVDGSVGGAILFSEMVTFRKQMERRQAFLLELASRAQAAPRDMVATATALLGPHLGVHCVGYAETDASGERLLVRHEYTDDSAVPASEIDELAPAFSAALRAGETIVVADIEADARTQAAYQAHLAAGTRALVAVPLLRDGHLRASLYLRHHARRAWTADEVQLLEDVAARMWTAIEQVRLTDDIERTMEEFRTLAEGLPALCWMAHPDGHICWYNQRWYDYTGSTPQEMLGSGWQSVHRPETLPLVIERWSACITTGTPLEMTFPLRGADGVFRPFLTRVVPVRGAGGEVQRWVGINTDVTDAAEREAALQRSSAALFESESRLQTIFDAAPVGIAIGSASGQIVAANRRMEVIFRYPVLRSPDDDADRGWVSFDHDGRRVEPHEYPLARALSGEERPVIDVLFERGDKSHAWVRLVAAPIRVGGQVTGAVVVAMDIDAEMRAREAVARAHETLEHRVIEEVRAREAAQAKLAQAEKLSALGQLASGIAHDFNNVMQAVSGGAGLMQRHADNPATVRRLGAVVEDAARRGASVTRRLLAFARQNEIRTEPLDVAALLGDLGEVLRHTLGAAVTVRMDAAEGLPPVMTERGQLETVLVNLATNARDAMPRGGTITIAARTEAIPDAGRADGPLPGEYVRLSVADTGTGIDADTLARVMEPFFTTKEQGKGTGLGLSMARGFAEQCGGALALESEPGRGTVVTLWLPASGEPLGRAVIFDGSGAYDRARAHRVLLVEDEELVREVLAEELSDRGYDVLQAEAGDTALALIDAGETIDLIISDLSMPGMDGVALIRAAQGRMPGLPAILLTGYAGEAASLALDGAVSGSFSLLRKPVTGAILADRVTVLLEAATTG